jgi:hypothetical protein
VTRRPDLALVGCPVTWDSSSWWPVIRHHRRPYRRLSAAARDGLRREILALVGRRKRGISACVPFNLVKVAINDDMPALRACVARESESRDAEYVLDLQLVGAAGVATVIDQVQVRRITELRADGSLVLAPSGAQPCIAEFLSRLAFFGCEGRARLEIVFRAEDCRPWK